MKKAGFVIAFVLLIAATAASVFLFQKNQAGAQKLINAERSLKDVKQAFEERGRLLVDVKMKTAFGQCNLVNCNKFTVANAFVLKSKTGSFADQSCEG